MNQAPRISARACIIRDGSILLSKYEDQRGFWYVTPGGGQQRGETLAECVAREAHEELGISVNVHEMICVREIIADRHHDSLLPQGFHQVEVFFRCTLPDSANPALGPNLDSGQVGHEWVELARLKEILFFPLGLADQIGNGHLTGKYVGEMR
jgi:8-oxo-dGTP diphosphatase